MGTIHRQYGFRFVIFVDDHWPPHVHILGHGGEMKVAIGGDSDLPVVVSVVGIKQPDRRRLLDVVRNRRVEWLELWYDIHGDMA